MENQLRVIEGRPMAWTPKDLDPSVVVLNEHGVAEVQETLRKFKGRCHRVSSLFVLQAQPSY